MLQSQDLLLPTLLDDYDDDAVFFALILEEFFGNFLCYHFFLKRERERDVVLVYVAKNRMLRTVS